MAGPDRKSALDLNLDLLKQGHGFSFFQALRLLRLFEQQLAPGAAAASDDMALCPFCDTLLPTDSDECPTCARELHTPPSTWVLLRLWRFARPYQWQLLSGFLLTLASTAATLVPPEEAIPSLDTLLAELPQRSARPRDRLRVVIEGAFCEQPPIGLLEVLEEAGCYVVEDDLMLGWRWYTADVPTDGDPFERLGAAYVNQSVPSSTRHESREHRSAGLIEKVRRASAQAVIFMPAKFCEPALFDYVLMKQGLERAGIPHMIVEFEEKMWTFERTRNEIETFVESMLFE